MPHPTALLLRRRATVGPVVALALLAPGVLAPSSGAVPAGPAVRADAGIVPGGTPASSTARAVVRRAQTPPGGSMTRQLPQDITLTVRGRSVSVHFGSLRRRATRTATIRFTRSGARAVVRTAPASGTLRLTAPKGSRRVRLTVPRTQEWTPTSITRSIRR